MTYATVTTQIHESLDVHRNFAAQITFDIELAHFAAQCVEISFTELLNLGVRVHTRCRTHFSRGGPPNAKDGGQRDNRMLVVRAAARPL